MKSLTHRASLHALIALSRITHGDPSAAPLEWTHWGGDSDNSHYARAEKTITPANVSRLKIKWNTKMANSVATIPSYSKGTLFVSDVAPAPAGVVQIFKKSSGNLNAVDAASGKILWSRPLTDYTHSKVRSMTRVTPAIYRDSLILGDSIDNVKFIKKAFFGAGKMPGSSVFAISQKTGDLLWKTEVDPRFYSRITQSATVYGDTVFVGVSSQESQIPGIRAFVTRIAGKPMDPIRYECCSFRGKMVALDARTGRIKWQTEMIPPPPPGTRPQDWYSGAPIWGSAPAVDPKRGLLYIATGNNYNSPAALKKCVEKAAKIDDAAKSTEATAACSREHDIASNLFDSIVALDLETGKIRWSFKATLFDTWTVACGKEITKIPPEDRRSCPSRLGKDYDFGQAPMLLHAVKNRDGITRDLVVAGQKSGYVFALDADNGALVWKTETGPGGELGGHELGSATDGKTIYTQSTNLNHYPVTLKGAATPVNGGFWSAIDAATGELRWQTADPSSALPLKAAAGEKGMKHPVYGKGLAMGQFAAAFGPITLSPGLVWAGSLAKGMYAMDAETGKILWSFESSGSVASAPTIINGVVYWGTGYGLGFDSKDLYAFSIDGK